MGGQLGAAIAGRLASRGASLLLVDLAFFSANAIKIPEGAGPELEKRFHARAHSVDGSPGFLGFQLLRPVKGEDRYFVVTNWETEEDFQATLDVVERARFSSAFTFQYSKRPGTPAAELPDQLPKEVVSERYMRLIELQERISWEENLAQVGREVELLVATGEGRKDSATERMTGRARDGRLVHFAPGALAEAIRPGDIVSTVVTAAAPHHLIADGGVDEHRRTRAGDATRTDDGQPAGTAVGLGIPTLGAPTPEPQGQTGGECESGCSW